MFWVGKMSWSVLDGRERCLSLVQRVGRALAHEHTLTLSQGSHCFPPPGGRFQLLLLGL